MAINYILQAFFFPPASLLLLMLLGVLLLNRKPQLGKSIIISGVLLCYLSSIPAVSNPLSRLLHVYPAVTSEIIKANNPQAIVILGGGRYAQAPEYNGMDTASEPTLVRLRYGVHLARETNIPILTTGGRVFIDDDSPSEAELMASTIKKEWGIDVKWTESRSLNSYENALYSHEMLAKEGINRILLVTHSQHMLRSVEAFEHQGFEVTPAPTVIAHDRPSLRPKILDWIPNAGALKTTHDTLHESVGRLWYHIRYY